jgi:hypothetical protein
MLNLLLQDSLPSDVDIAESFEGFVDRCLRLYYLGGEKEALMDEDDLRAIAENGLQFLLHLKSPSVFKVAAAFTLCAASLKPFKTPLPEAFNPVRADQNIVLGILESCYWLHGAELITTAGLRRIESPLNFSDHYFTELVQTVSFACQSFSGSFGESDDRAKVGLLALLYEAVVYKTNNHVPYKENPLVDVAKVYYDFPL